jgi:hypothetical protein
MWRLFLSRNIETHSDTMLTPPLLLLQGGIMYFQEYKNFTRLTTSMFILGTAITGSGIVYLLRDRMGGGAASCCVPFGGRFH